VVAYELEKMVAQKIAEVLILWTRLVDYQQVKAVFQKILEELLLQVWVED